jgi:hypothetical protein
MIDIRRRGLWVATAVTGLGIIALGLIVAAMGLDHADKIASVVGAVVAMFGLVLALLTFRRGDPPASAGIVAAGNISGIAAIGHAGAAQQGGTGSGPTAPGLSDTPPPQGTIKAGGSISGIAAIGDGRGDIQDQNR